MIWFLICIAIFAITLLCWELFHKDNNCPGWHSFGHRYVIELRDKPRSNAINKQAAWYDLVVYCKRCGEISRTIDTGYRCEVCASAFCDPMYHH